MKSLKFGQTLMDDKELDWMVINRMVERASVRLPGNEVVPDPKPYECVVFQDQFTTGLRMCRVEMATRGGVNSYF